MLSISLLAMRLRDVAFYKHFAATRRVAAADPAQPACDDFLQQSRLPPKQKTQLKLVL